jgi:hypothetical protein
MADTFATYLTTHGSFTKAELGRIAALASPKKLKRHEQLLLAGDVCRYEAFVVQGLLRLYRVGPDATEQIMLFAAENWGLLTKRKTLAYQVNKPCCFKWSKINLSTSTTWSFSA